MKHIQQRCETLVVARVGLEKSFDWWLTPNRAFDMQTPEVAFYFDPQVVYKYLMDPANE